MKVKMTRQQLEGLELIIRIMLTENKPIDPATKLIYDIVYKFYAKIRQRIERIAATKEGWSIKFGEQEALAMHVFISNYPIPTGYLYEELQLDIVYRQLDQEYGRLICTDSEYKTVAS